MLSDTQTLALCEKLAGALPGDGPVRIEGMERIFGGASRETCRFDAIRGDVRHALILRRDQAAALIDTERKLEFAAYRTFTDTAVPVPRAVLLEEGSETLGSPFFIMGRVNGVAGSPFQADCYGADAPAIATDFFTHLGAIGAADPAGSPLSGAVDTPAPDQCWQRELDHWAGVLERDSVEPQPIALAAIRKLRAEPPPPPKRLSVVHGDYRSGNFLVHEGRISAILDWEMAHIGDAHEDLAWALDPMWSHDPDKPLLGIHRGKAIALWEHNSGLKLDPEALWWWGLFTAVKGVAIWTSAGKAFASGANMDLVNAWSAWYCTQFHDRQMAQALLQGARS